MHPCEPSLKELKELQKQLFVQESTDENLKKLRALEFQIARREEEEAAAAEVKKA